MIKRKPLLLAFGLACSSLSFAAELTAVELFHPQKRGTQHQAKYVIAYGKIIAKFTAAGYTKFNYRDGIVVSETGPRGVVGTYLYTHLGQLDEIQYNDGKRVKVSYAQDGKVKEVSGVGKVTARFKKDAPIAPKGKEKIGNFLSVQAGMEVMDIGDPVCVEGSEEECIVNIGGSLGGGGYGGFIPRFPSSGGGGGSGGRISPIGPTGSPYETPEHCKSEVCDDGNRDMIVACKIMTKSPATLQRCTNKANEFYAKCLRSCSNGDWSWLENFNFVW